MIAGRCLRPAGLHVPILSYLILLAGPLGILRLRARGGCTSLVVLIVPGAGLPIANSNREVDDDLFPLRFALVGGKRVLGRTIVGRNDLQGTHTASCSVTSGCFHRLATARFRRHTRKLKHRDDCASRRLKRYDLLSLDSACSSGRFPMSRNPPIKT